MTSTGGTCSSCLGVGRQHAIPAHPSKRRSALLLVVASTAASTATAAATPANEFSAGPAFVAASPHPGARRRAPPAFHRSAPSQRVALNSGDSSFHPPLPTYCKMGSSDIADSYAKWDNLSDDDDEDGEGGNMPIQKRVPPDMRYEVRNIHRQASNYDAIRGAGGRDVVNDVYLRSPGDEVAWLVGRVASISDVPPPRAIDRQFPLIERHGWLLRPVDLHPRRGPFEVWYTERGESDEDVLAGNPDVTFRRVEEDDVRVDDASKQDVRSNEVGFKAVSYGDDYSAGDDDEQVGVRLTADGRIAMAGEDLAAPLITEEGIEVEAVEADVLEKMRSAPSLEDLLDDTDFQELMDKM